MGFDVTPGVNRWLGAGAEPGKGGPRSALHCDRPTTAHKLEPRPRDTLQGCPSYLPMNADPRLLPDHPRVYIQPNPARTAQAGLAGSRAAGEAHQLGAALNTGYGRVPTAYVYTSADTVLPTTHYQTPLAALGRAANGPWAAAEEPLAARMTSRGRLLQAFTFSSASGSSMHSGSPPTATPARSLLYTRGGHSWGPAPQQTSTGVDLLDRMTLLRRLAPATDPAARPPSLAPCLALHPGRHHFTPAPQHAPPRRWAWDDSKVGQPSVAAVSSSHAAPIAHVPAPGWRYCGDVVAAAATAGGHVSVMVAHEGGSSLCGSPVAVSAAAGRTAEWEDNGGSEVVVMLRSPRAHQLGAVEWEGDGMDEAELEADSSALGAQGSSKPPFRPPGPLQHKHGNRPRPCSAPSAADQAARRAKAAGLRECGCPRSPRVAADVAGYGAGGGKQLRWQDEGWGPADAATRPGSPRGAASLPSFRPPVSKQANGRLPAQRAAGGGKVTTTAATTTTVEVSTGHGGTNLVLISSPSAAVGLGVHERGELLVACASPRCSAAVAVDGGSVEVALTRHAAPPPAAGWSQAGSTQVPPGRQASSVVRHAAKVGRGCGSGTGPVAASPAAKGDGQDGAAGIKAWRSAPAPQRAQGERCGASSAGRGLAMELEMLLSPRAALGTTEGLEEEEGLQELQAAAEEEAGEEAGRRHAHAQLHALSGEMRRRERSFGQLLEELERISRKCSALTAAAAGAAAAQAPPASEAAAGAVSSAAACTRPKGEQQQPQLHTTHNFDAGPFAEPATPSRHAPRRQPPAAARPGSAAATAAAAACQPAGRWSCEGLVEFERTVRERQHQSGGLPKESA